MTALRREAMQLMKRLPEEKFPYLIQYIRELEIETPMKEQKITPKMKAFMELEQMLIPAAEDLDYDKELAKARDKKYGNIS